MQCGQWRSDIRMVKRGDARSGWKGNWQKASSSTIHFRYERKLPQLRLNTPTRRTFESVRAFKAGEPRGFRCASVQSTGIQSSPGISRLTSLIDATPSVGTNCVQEDCRRQTKPTHPHPTSNGLKARQDTIQYDDDTPDHGVAQQQDTWIVLTARLPSSTSLDVWTSKSTGQQSFL